MKSGLLFMWDHHFANASQGAIGLIRLFQLPLERMV